MIEYGEEIDGYPFSFERDDDWRDDDHMMHLERYTSDRDHRRQRPFHYWSQKLLFFWRWPKK